GLVGLGLARHEEDPARPCARSRGVPARDRQPGHLELALEGGRPCPVAVRVCRYSMCSVTVFASSRRRTSNSTLDTAFLRSSSYACIVWSREPRGWPLIETTRSPFSKARR